MTLKAQIEKDIKQAMLDKKQEELIALRAIKSAILLAETEKGASNELSSEAETRILSKAAKQRKESAEVFKNQNRDDLASKELAELEIINRYLPQPLSEEELSEKVKNTITAIGAASMVDMGKVMGVLSKKLAGQVDGKALSDQVKQQLSGS